MDELESITRDYLSTLGNPNTPISLSLKIENYNIHKLIMPAVMMMADSIIKGGEIDYDKVTRFVEYKAKDSTVFRPYCHFVYPIRFWGFYAEDTLLSRRCFC